MDSAWSPLDNRSVSTQDRQATLRETLALASVILIIALAAILGLWITTSGSIRDNYRHYLTGIAVTASQLVDPALHQSLRDAAQLNDSDYLRAVTPLRRMRASVPDVRYVYTMVRDGKDYRFVLDAAEPGDHDGDGVEDQAGIWEVYQDREPAMLAAMGTATENGVAGATTHPFADKWGNFMTGWAPLKDDAGHQYGALGVDVDASVYIARLDAARNWALVGVLPATFLTLLLSAAFYRVRLRYLAATRGAARAAEALAASESRFRSLFELSPVGICLADLGSGRFLQVNDALVNSTGYGRDELLQLSYRDITPPRWHAIERDYLSVLDHGNHFGTYEKEYQRKDGSCYPVLISGTRVRDASGRDLAWAIVQDISERKKMESELTDAARRDRLTGLANRMVFLEWLQTAVTRVREGKQARFAVLFLDFDRFKLVNDAMGHAAGDTLLREIAARLQFALAPPTPDDPEPEGRLIARFGGDEFLVLLNDIESCEAAAVIAAELLDDLARTYNVMGREVYSTASIGIVTSDQCIESADAILRNADIAMYEAKKSGRACAVMFDETIRTQLTRAVTVETELRKALGTPQVSLVYQPIVALESGRTKSVEALVRWHHPELGMVSPAEFIPVAEDSGLIAPLGHWVLKEACMAMARWRERFPNTAPATISVNISRAELASGKRLLTRVREVLHECKLPPGCLQLEVTEREVMREPEATLRLMHALREMGVRLAMDDFGTGTSSLGCLRDYPFDVIKVDRSFVQDISANADVLAVIHATIALITNLGKASVAEGVERPEQVAVLQSLGCHYAQGYYFSRPMPEQDLVDAMSNPPVSDSAAEQILLQPAASSASDSDGKESADAAVADSVRSARGDARLR